MSGGVGGGGEESLLFWVKTLQQNSRIPEPLYRGLGYWHFLGDWNPQAPLTLASKPARCILQTAQAAARGEPRHQSVINSATKRLLCDKCLQLHSTLLTFSQNYPTPKKKLALESTCQCWPLTEVTTGTWRRQADRQDRWWRRHSGCLSSQGGA